MKICRQLRCFNPTGSLYYQTFEGGGPGVILISFVFVVVTTWHFAKRGGGKGVVHLIASPGIIGVYFPQELANQINCCITGLGPNHSITPGDGEAALPHPTSKPIHHMTYSNS